MSISSKLIFKKYRQWNSLKPSPFHIRSTKDGIFGLFNKSETRKNLKSSSITFPKLKIKLMNFFFRIWLWLEAIQRAPKRRISLFDGLLYFEFQNFWREIWKKLWEKKKLFFAKILFNKKNYSQKIPKSVWIEECNKKKLLDSSWSWSDDQWDQKHFSLQLQ